MLGLNGLHSLLHHCLLGGELLHVMVADDIEHLGLGHAAAQLVEVEEAVITIGPGGDHLRGQGGIDLHGDQQGVLHGVLGTAGVDGNTGNIDLCAGGVEVLILDLTLGAAVDGVCVLCAEGGGVKVVGALADLLVGGEGDAQLAVGNVLSDDLLAHGHDLGDTCLVIRAQQGGAVSGDEGAALELSENGEISHAQHTALPGQGDIAAVIVLVQDGVNIRAGEGRRGVHMGQQTKRGGILIAGGGGQDSGDNAKLAGLDILQAQFLQLVHQDVSQIPLAGGAGAGSSALGRLSVDACVLQKALVSSHWYSSVFFDDTYSIQCCDENCNARSIASRLT